MLRRILACLMIVVASADQPANGEEVWIADYDAEHSRDDVAYITDEGHLETLADSLWPTEDNAAWISDAVTPIAMQVVPPATPVQPESLPTAPPMENAGDGARETSAITASMSRILESLEDKINAPERTAPPGGIGETLTTSPAVQTVSAQRRSSVSFDPNVRGFRQGQIYTTADSAYWFAARQDLDTMLSKIDEGIVESIGVIQGPYGVEYGPGFAFIDVQSALTPRYEDGPETHFRSTVNVRTNGGQIYGRETAYGGDRDWGYRVSYGHRRGSDYEAGNSLKIPTSYQNRDVWAQLGRNLDADNRLEASFVRLDQTDVEVPAQFFDIGYLGVDGGNVRWVRGDTGGWTSGLRAEAWYNRSRFNGNTQNKSNPCFPVMTRVERVLDEELGLPIGSSQISALTTGDNYSTGARGAFTVGSTDASHLDIGADFRYLSQRINEDYTTNTIGEFSTNMPRALLRDPGIYSILALPWNRWNTTKFGGRVDFTTTSARVGDLALDTNLIASPGDSLTNHDILYAINASHELRLDETWKVVVAGGHAQRPPTLIERYADGLFLGVLQSGFTRVIGDPDLKKERNWQVDAGLEGESGALRAQFRGFHAWIQDYITVEDDTVVNFADARLVRYHNTELATLTGCSAYTEYDVNANWTPFASLGYVDGRDRVLHAPLPAIFPLDGRIGLRWHARERERWGVETSVRIVNEQDRLGTILLNGAPEVVEERTPGFTVCYLAAYARPRDNLTLLAGIDNVFDRNYQTHLDLRLLSPVPGIPEATRVLSPGFSPYMGLEWTY